MQLILILIALVATIVTYSVSLHALRQFNVFESPRPLAAVVALLTGLSMFSVGSSVILLILIPYAALGVSLLLLPLLKWLLRNGNGNDFERWLQDRSSRWLRRPSESDQSTNQTPDRCSPRPRDTPPTEDC